MFPHGLVIRRDDLCYYAHAYIRTHSYMHTKKYSYNQYMHIGVRLSQESIRHFKTGLSKYFEFAVSDVVEIIPVVKHMHQVCSGYVTDMQWTILVSVLTYYYYFTTITTILLSGGSGGGFDVVFERSR